jgi:hypothetical protein
VLINSSDNNTVVNNTVTYNKFEGILLWQVVSSPWGVSSNVWDSGYPSGANFWNDYDGADFSGSKQNETGSDGIGDFRYVNSFGEVDRYPLMELTTVFCEVLSEVLEGRSFTIEVVSNSTLSGFRLSNGAKTVSFNVTGEEGTNGFCRLVIPSVIVRDLWDFRHSVLVNGNQSPLSELDGSVRRVHVHRLHESSGSEHCSRILCHGDATSSYRSRRARHTEDDETKKVWTNRQRR